MVIPWVAALVLALNLLGIAASLWCVLFGPSIGVFLGLVGFLVGVLAGLLLLTRTRPYWLDAGPAGLASGRPVLNLLRVPLNVALALAGVVVFASLAIGFAAARFDGVPEQAVSAAPVFAERPAYRLNSHGKYTTVSRARYVAVGASFMIGWHTMAMLPTVLSLEALLSGSSPFARGDAS